MTLFKMADFFPDLLYVFEQIEAGNQHYCPNAPSNERNYFNKLRGFKKKKIFFNPNKAGLFYGSFFRGEWANLNPLSYFKKNLSNINITLYNC